MKKKKVELYPIYLKNSKWNYYCLLNEKKAIGVELYAFKISIIFYIEDGGTWVHKFQEDYTKVGESEFKKALKKAMKILQKKL